MLLRTILIESVAIIDAFITSDNGGLSSLMFEFWCFLPKTQYANGWYRVSSGISAILYSVVQLELLSAQNRHSRNPD